MRLFKPAPPKVESGAMKNSRSDSRRLLHISLLTRLIARGRVASHLKTYSTVSKTGALAATSRCSVRRPSTSAALQMLLSARMIRVSAGASNDDGMMAAALDAISKDLKRPRRLL